MKELNDTITAIATAPGESAIAIVRVAGPASLAIADSIFRGRKPLPSQREPNTFIHGHIVEPELKSADNRPAILDEVLLLIFKAPHSYTGDDAVEIQCHGGNISARRILRAVVSAGARLAEPGEFTKRAFLNQRIDLVQSEAVLDLIRSKSDRAASAAIDQLEGRLSRSLASIYDNIMAISSDVTALLDFYEEAIINERIKSYLDKLKLVRKEFHKLIDTWHEGHLLREGALVVISGRANVGKSTLLNKLLGKDRAIVTEVPGTTRDTIEEQIVLNGIPIRIVDTAGLRETDCKIEKEGIVRAYSYISKADIQLVVVDGSVPLNQDEIDYIKKLNSLQTIIIINKSDLGINSSNLLPSHNADTITCSLIRDEGIDKIKALLVKKLDVQAPHSHPAVISERHRIMLTTATNEVESSISILTESGEEGLVFAASHMKTALEAIGEIIGRVYFDDLLNTIFSRFCIGK